MHTISSNRRSNLFAAICRPLIMLLLIVAPSVARSAESPEQMLQRSAAKITKAKTIDARFTINGSQSGTLKVSGKKFMVSAGSANSWYDGKKLYTYSAATNETTLVLPSKQELAEVNPLYYVGGTKGKYNLAFAAKSPAGSRTVVLTPKSRHDAVKKAEVTVSLKTYMPTNIRIYAKSGGSTNIRITSLKTGVSIPSGIFTYPKNKYPKTKIIDLR